MQTQEIMEKLQIQEMQLDNNINHYSTKNRMSLHYCVHNQSQINGKTPL